MELTDYTVKTGDTLGDIAQQCGSSVAQLRQLNRFIPSSNILKSGWNLSVPAQGRAGVAARPTSSAIAPSEAEKPPAAPPVSKVLELDPQTKPKPSGSVYFGPQEKLPCSLVYANIIYATHEKEFWLLSAEAANALKESASKLSELIAPDMGTEARQKVLYACDLLDYFLEPKLVNFLEGAQKARMLEIEAQEPLIADPRYAMEVKTAVETRQRDISAKSVGPIDPYERHDPLEANDRMLAQYKKYRELLALHQEWKKLANAGQAEAQRQGYVIEGGTLFTPEALKVREIVQTYLSERAKLLDDKGQLTTFSVDDVASVLQAASGHQQRLESCLLDCDAELVTYYALQTQEAAKFAYPNYLDAILKAADYGIALPELALCQGSDLNSGVQAVKHYLALQLQQAGIKQRLFDKYETWINASGENIKAPDSLVADERTAWTQLQTDLEAIRQLAENNVASTVPRRHLLWEPDQFKPTPVERLVKPDFPLREISWPAGTSPVHHISLTVLKALKDKTAAKWTGNSSGKSATDQAHSVFQQWLRSMGSIPIADQGPWFDQEGCFDVELFYSQLKQQNYEVKTLVRAEQRKTWGDQLRQMLFFKGAQRELRLFDSSPQAQLIRCLTPQVSNVQREVSTTTKFSRKGLDLSVTGRLDVNLAMGEVELFKLDWPERTAAQDIKVQYQRSDGQGVAEMNVGRFSFDVSAHAWGFAGAAMMASAGIYLTPSNTKYGAGLSAIQDAQAPAGQLAGAHTQKSAPVLSGKAANVQVKDGATADFNLFAGVQAGVRVSGALNWAPPQDLVMLRTVSLLTDPAQRARQSGAQWLSLARLEGDIGAAAGVGISGEFTLSADKGQLILRIKAGLICGAGAKGTFAFQIGYDGIYELLNLFRRELHKNHGQPLDWVDGSALDLMSKMNLLGLAGLDPVMLYLMGFDKVAELCEALTSGGKGGPIAHTIMNYSNPAELEQWTIEAIPEALGPMLMTLISEAKAFTAIDVLPDPVTGKRIDIKTHYTESQCWMLQQKAITQLLNWIVANAQKKGSLTAAQIQFEAACMRMSRFGTKSDTPGQSYCENRLRLDNFMAEGVGRLLERRADEIRAHYKARSTLLGSGKDKCCERRGYYGRDYVPGGTAKYTGEGQ
ncbi:LysM peptidoglycan-binding domain-containing protein [Pseudomonas sp. PDM25]|uniref:LysM peptidoglycan-binding domain-containing protein n=1 Tax=Pseudomonas sp. PDM25 TaxID=2854772 RepID=UPI001C448EEE|nr:LysM peptidoglycan-binding domain-containing protein [Pseudomonas sp. PDM25]MBV7515879.1 LysM peptidoglycan-binding domain-containing protein [Pseudomonas sp. PDM25]